mgnify:CR=1 FL=1
MAQITMNDLGIKLNVGDIITYVSLANCETSLTVTKISEKSIYLNYCRNSYGTLKKLMNLKDFTVLKK